jgi:PAS domain S-box-containing protein/putative nucleotidyltransferase with HDIG domain
MLHNRSFGYLAAVLGMGAVTAICALLRSHINEMTVALAMLLTVLFIAAAWGRWPGLLASVLGMLCLNYFFLPPIYTFTIADPKNWIALAAFFITALTAGQLSAWIEQRAEALRRSADEIRDLYNRAPCGYHSVDKDGVFVRVNDTELSWLGYTREEMIGKLKFSDLVTPVGVRTVEENFPKLKAQGVVRDLEYDMVRKDGTILPVLLSATAVTDSAGNYLMSRSTIYDITARKQAENEVRKLARLQSVVADLGERALQGAPLSQMLDDAADQVARALGVDYCKILEFLPNRDALLMRSGAGWKPGYVGHATVGLGTESQAGYTLTSDEPVVVEDLQTEKRFAGTALLHEHEVVSGASVVVSTSEGPHGVLAVHTRQRRSFTTDEVNFLQAVANVLGSVIERHRAEAQLWRVSQAQRVLSKCNEALIRATGESTLLQQICDLIVEEAGYRLCWVGRAENDAAKSVTAIAQAGFEAGYLATVNVNWADTERGRGPTGTCIRTRETVVAKHIATDPKMIPWRAEALKRGYGSSVAIPLMIDSQIFGAIMIYAAEPGAFGTEEVKLLTELAGDLAFGIGTLRTRAERDRSAYEHKHHAEILQKSLEQSIRAIADTVDARDPYTAGHQRRVAELAVAIAREMGLPEQTVHGIQLAAVVHDLGKIHVPAEILTKPGKLSDIEFMLIKTHPQAGYDILKDVEFPWPIADIVRQHHERLDGSGYPQGLKDGQILLESRIMAVADVVETMSSHRPYRPSLGMDLALKEIERGRGSAYDPAVADACVKLFREGRFAFHT